MSPAVQTVQPSPEAVMLVDAVCRARTIREQDDATEALFAYLVALEAASATPTT